MGLAQADDGRFPFGENWRRFLASLDDRRIEESEAALGRMLDVQNLQGRSFLDIGSGSGLTSLAAHRMGARVHSFDYDPQSVACTTELRRRFAPDDAAWTIERGSVLDPAFMSHLGQFDVVYAWGVLHHTQDMWRAMEHAIRSVAPGGTLFIAIYNDQGWISGYWRGVKRLYNAGVLPRALIVATHAPYLLAGRWLAGAARGRFGPGRGMSLWYDMLDWLGGWPFECAPAQSVIAFHEARGFSLLRQNPGRRHGCNEFVLKKMD